jgi:type I restriction enzyme, R subunit
MLRPTTPAIKYAQMRGRGSRLCPGIGKTDFLIYDFVNNTANFDDPGQQYHRPKSVGSRPRPGQNDNGDDGREPSPSPPSRPRPPSEFTIISEGSLEDVFRRRQTIIVGPDGLAMDRREYQDRWLDRGHLGRLLNLSEELWKLPNTSEVYFGKGS